MCVVMGSSVVSVSCCYFKFPVIITLPIRLYLHHSWIIFYEGHLPPSVCVGMCTLCMEGEHCQHALGRGGPPLPGLVRQVFLGALGGLVTGLGLRVMWDDVFGGVAAATCNHRHYLLMVGVQCYQIQRGGQSVHTVSP